MMLGEERWRERCDRYFSSITDVRQEADAAAAAAAVTPAQVIKKTKKKDSDSKKGKTKTPVSNKPTVSTVLDTVNAATAAAAERRTKQTTKQTTMKKTTEDRVIIRANGRAYRTKHRPFKGPRRWLSSMDVHGTSMLQRTESASYFFIWLLLILAGCGALAYLLYLIIGDYLQGDTHYKVLMAAGSLDLPLAVSVCNMNPLRKTRLFGSRFAGLLRLNNSALFTNFQQVRPADIELLLRKTQLQRFLERPDYSHLNLTELLLEIEGEYPLYGSMSTETDWSSLYASSLRSGHYDLFARALRVTASEMYTMSHDMQSSMMLCLKNGHACDSADMSFPMVQELGNCATINLSTDSSTWFDKLSMIYDVEPEEYMDYVTSSRGLRVFLHTPQGGFWRKADFSAQVGSVLRLHVVKVTEIERLSSNCNEDTAYNYEECMQSCMEEVTRSVCGCARSISVTLNQRCRTNVQYEYMCYRTIEMLAKMDQLQCNCPNNCRDHLFDVQVSQASWPVQIYESHLRRSLMENGIVKNFPTLRDSLTKIEISLGHTQRVLLKEQKDIPWLQLLIQIGAVSALTAGISVVTGVEFVWVLGRLFCQCAKAAWRGRHDDNQVKALTTESLPEFDDLGFNWYTMQNQDADRNNLRGGPMMTTETELTPPTAPNLLGLHPIVEESDVDVRAVDGAEEDKLYTHAWERSGQSRPYTRVLVSGKDANISDAPLLNAPGNNTSLRSEMYRPSSDSPPSASQINGPRPAIGSSADKHGGRSSGNYILKSRAPYTWHSAHYNGGTSRQAVMTPADFINVYGQPARQLYEDDDNQGFYLS